MPTKRRRHAVTETPEVEAALDDLRAELPEEERVGFNELVILGAREKLARLRSERSEREGRLESLAERIRSGNIPIDPEAAEEVKRSGWTPH
ncbi:MAG: hypothetical protein M3350_07980 [Actinomycetota bacterium]|nr:hypothetical protein [Actinomycetota bacterium]MDQ3720699.1 hypothetical protein [Actinomycetota bacterium]